MVYENSESFMENTVKCWVGRGLLGGGCNSGGSVRFLKLNSVASLKRIGKKKKKKKTIAATLSSAFEVKRLWVSESDTSDLPLEAFVTGAYILLSSTQKLQCHQFPFYLHFTLTQYLLICHTDTHTHFIQVYLPQSGKNIKYDLLPSEEK